MANIAQFDWSFIIQILRKTNGVNPSLRKNCGEMIKSYLKSIQESFSNKRSQFCFISLEIRIRDRLNKCHLNSFIHRYVFGP